MRLKVLKPASDIHAIFAEQRIFYATALFDY